MPYRGLRDFLNRLAETGDLVEVEKAVDIKYEIAAYIRKTSDEDGPALYFKNVKGYNVPVVGGLFANRRKFLLAMESTEQEAVQKFLLATRNKVPPKLVSNGPCQDVVLTGKDVDLSSLPVTINSEKDGGQFISIGIQISKDPETGSKNAGIYRMQVKGKNRLGLFAPGQDIDTQLKKAEAKDQALEIAVAIGTDPSIVLSSTAKVPYEIDELEIAGALRGSPVEVVKCKTVDLEVPATSEYVIEGKIPSHIREHEGPYGEYTGYYGPADEMPIVEVSAITRAKDPIYHTLLTGMPTTENQVLKDIPRAATLYDRLSSGHPTIKAIHFPSAGATHFMVAVSFEPRYKGEPRRLLSSILGAIDVKLAIVVNTDIDVFNLEQVMWAVMTRCQPHEDLIELDGLLTLPLDPFGPPKGVAEASAIGIDATVPYGKTFDLVKVPGVSEVTIPKQPMKTRF